jgi:uncharacterized membrane protein YccC
MIIFVPATLFALISREAHHYRWAALTGVILGFLVNTIFVILGVLKPEWFEPRSSFIPGFLTALLAMFIHYLLIHQKVKNHDPGYF